MIRAPFSNLISGSVVDAFRVFKLRLGIGCKIVPASVVPGKFNRSFDAISLNPEK